MTEVGGGSGLVAADARPAYRVDLARLWRLAVGRAGQLVARSPLFWGSLIMLLTTSLWALAFVAPIVLERSSAAEITVGRFLVYGVISLASLGIAQIRRLTRRVFAIALVFAVTGNVAYYFVLTVGIQLSGASLAVLIIGMLPVTVSFYGRMAAKEGTFKDLALPLALFVVGVVIFNLGKTGLGFDLTELSLVGTACLAASLAMWTWYAVANARFLRTQDRFDAREWSCVVGVASLATVLIAVPVLYASGELRDPSTIPSEELAAGAFWSIVLGGGSTWLGTVLFNLAARLLKVTLLGQLIIFEAVFGLLYIFLAAGEVPGVVELLGVSLALLGIWWSIRRLQREP